MWKTINKETGCPRVKDDDFAGRKCCFNATKSSRFYIGLRLMMKNGSPKPQTQRIICEIWPTSQSTVKPNIIDTTVMFCIWWNQKCVLYYEL